MPGAATVIPRSRPHRQVCAWERAQVYLGLYERYQELYQAQVTELHLLMATAPGCSLPLSHRRPLTDPLTETHTGYISLNCARLQQTKRKGQFPVQNGGDARLVLVTGLRGATVRSAKLGMRTGWNAAAACHRAGLAGTFGVMEN